MTSFLPERHYPNAPITEAVIDLAVVFAPDADVSVESLEQLSDVAFPASEPVIFNHVQVSGSNTAAVRRDHVGTRFRSADGLYVYQARTNGFGLSRLAPYQNWAAFRSEARRLWSKYREATKPISLQRLGLRYINRIEIPLPVDDFADYFLTGPQLSPHLPQGLSSYLLNLTVPVDGLITATITQAILNPEAVPALKRDALPMLLDIDVSQTLALPTDENALWECFEQLRKVKNHVFESCITDKARELFQ